MGMVISKWTGETLRRRSKQDLSPQRIRGNGKEESKKSFYFLKDKLVLRTDLVWWRSYG